MTQYRNKITGAVVQAVRFDAERWIYERAEAFPMVKFQPCNGGISSLGVYFTYQPVIRLANGDDLALMGDEWLLLCPDGLYRVELSDDFNKNYELI